MASTAELQLLIKARDEASGVLGAVSKKAGGLANVMGKAIRTGALAGGVAVAGLGIAAVKMGLDFEKSMAEVKTLLPDLSEEGFGQLKSDVLDLSKELGIATSEAVPALYQAISAGVPPDNVMDFMRVASKAAIGGVTNLETAVDGITSVINAYGEGAIDAGTASDQMFTAVKLGKTTFEELSASLFNVIPTAAASGVEFGDIAASLAVMTAQGTKTTVATTGLRQALVEVGKTGTNLDKALRDLSGKGFNDLIAQGESMPAIFESLRASMPDQEFKDLFGSVEAMTSVLQLTGPNFEKTQEAMDAMASSGGAVEGAFETMADTASFKLNKAINLLKVTLTEVGVKILPLLTKALNKALPFLEKNLPKAIEAIEGAIEDARPVVEKFVKAFSKGIGVLKDAIEPLFQFIISNKPALIAAIAAIGIAILLAFGPGAIAIVAIIGLIALIGVIKDNWDSLKIVIIPVGIALGIVAGVILVAMIPALIGMAAAGIAAVLPWLLLAIPIIAIVAVIALVVAAILLLIKHFDEVKAALGEAASFIGDRAGEVKDFLVDAFKTVLDFLKANWPLILAIIMGPIGLIVLGIITFKDDIVRIFGEVITFIKGLPGKILSALGNLATLLTQKGKDLLLGFVKGYAGVWLTILDFFIGLPGVLARKITDSIGALWQVGWDFLSGLWQGIKARAFSLFNDLKNLADDILRFIKDPLGIRSPSTVMQDLGDNMILGLLGGLKGRFPDVEAWMRATFGASGAGESRTSGAFISAAKFGSLSLRMRDFGLAIISSFLGGMRSKWLDVISWVRGAVAELKAEIKVGLEIGSPSKVFRGYGADIIKGLQLGLESQEPRLNLTAGRTAAAVVAPVAAPAAAPAGAGLPEALRAALSGMVVELDGEVVGRIVDSRIGARSELLMRGG